MPYYCKNFSPLGIIVNGMRQTNGRSVMGFRFLKREPLKARELQVKKNIMGILGARTVSKAIRSSRGF